MTFLTIYNDTLHRSDFKPNYEFIADLDLVLNREEFPRSICKGCIVLTGDTHSSATLFSPIWDLRVLCLLIPILFPFLLWYLGLCNSNIPRYFLNLTLQWSDITLGCAIAIRMRPGASFESEVADSIPGAWHIILKWFFACSLPHS